MGDGLGRDDEGTMGDSITFDEDELTPINDLRQMGVAIATIKRDVGEMKPEVKETAKAVVMLATKQRVADNRIKALEGKTDVLNGKAADMAKQSAVGAGATATVSQEVSALKVGHSRFVYWLMGAAVVVIGSVVGWYASYQVTTNEVRHLTTEQSKIRTNLESLQKTTKAIPGQINSAASRVETAANTIQTNGDDHMYLDEIWCLLPERERLKLKRDLPLSKVPKVRCLR